MFEHLRRARSLLMGLAILGVAFYHAPFILHGPWVKLLHNALYCGVDMFLFLSGIGACHSLRSHGGREYLGRRAKRLLPGLYLFLIPWCLAMMLRGKMNGLQLLGSVTLLGWWLGEEVQLNWYFSAVWAFFLLALPAYGLFRRGRPVLVWLGLAAASLALGFLCPVKHLMTAVTRLPVFFTGMLLGVLEQRGFSRTGWLRGALIAAMPLGYFLVEYVFWGGGGDAYGYSLGLWWYPFWLLIPGAAALIADLAALLERSRLCAALLRPIRLCGESSAEILMFHVGLYKLTLSHHRNRVWLALLLGSVLLGCLYHFRVVERLPRLWARIRKKPC